MSPWRSKTVIFNLTLVAIVFAILVFVELPNDSYLWREFHNFGHTPLFGLTAIALLGISRKLIGDDFPIIIQYLISSALAFGLGMGYELIQIPTAGDSDPTDLLRNGAGILGLMSLKLALDRPYWRRRKKSDWKIRSKCFLFGGAVLIISALPLMIWSAAYVERENDFPSLSRFDSFLGRKFIFLKDSQLDLTPPPPGWSEGPGHDVARLILQADAEYPGIELGDPVPDWREFSHLWFEVYSPADSQISLSISIEDDEHNREYLDRYTSRIMLSPGLNRIKIDLAVVEQAPAGRSTNMAAIARIRLFTFQPTAPVELYLSDLSLR